MATEKRARKPVSHSHSLEQRTFVAWCRDMANWTVAPELRWIFAIPNAGKRELVSGRLLVAEGMERGVYDLMLPCARRGYHGLFMDFKVSRYDKLDDDQLAFKKFVEKQGFYTCTPNNARAAQDEVIWYLDIRNDPRVILLT